MERGLPMAVRLPKALIFDCDGTLVDSTPVWNYAQPELLRRHGIDASLDDFAEFESLALEDECEQYHLKWGICDSGDEVYRELFGILIDAYGKVSPRSGVISLLRWAREQGVSACVATSTPIELVQAALDGSGLGDYLEFVTTTGEAGRSKEFPDVYELALKRLNGRHGASWRPGETFVVEDAVFGLKSSGSAGFNRIGIFDPHGRMRAEDVERHCDIFIRDFDELDFGSLLLDDGRHA